MVFPRKLFAALLIFQMWSCTNVGETAPEFEFVTINGDTISSQSLQGKIIVFNVWATWCPTCLREIPDLNRLVRKYEGDTSIVFLALCDDDLEKANRALQNFPFAYKQIVDTDKFSDKLKTRSVKTYPQNLIINDVLPTPSKVSHLVQL